MIGFRLCKFCLAMLLAVSVLAGLPTWAETVVVKPSTMQATGWRAVTQRGASGEAAEEFAGGPGSVPAGSGSLHLWVGLGESDPLPKVYFGTNNLNGVRLDKITQLRLWVYPHSYSRRSAQPVTVELAVAKGDELRLCTFYPWGFEPTGYYGKMTWREVDLLAPSGAWAITNIDGRNARGNWNWLAKRYPGACVTTPPAQDWPHGTLPGTGLNIKIGAGKAAGSVQDSVQWWRESCGCNAYVDKLTVGYFDQTGKEVVTTYDFEPD
jgi:hypothetical protein